MEAPANRPPIGAMPERAPANWWEGFFEGLMVDFWRAAVPDDGAGPEADFLEKHLGIRPGDRVLDVPCGHGRLALELAARGYRVTGVDISADFLEEARRSGSVRGLTVEWEQGDMREVSSPAPFDAAFCAGNSFGYFDDAGNAAFLARVARSLKAGGRFLLDSGWMAETLLPNFREKIEAEVSGIRFRAENRYDPESGRVENRFTVSRGQEEVSRLASHRIYTYRELASMLRDAGLEVVTTFGSLSGEPYGLGSHRLLLVARRPV